MNDIPEKAFDLGRDTIVMDYKGENKKPVEKTEKTYPSVYIWKAPVELARALAKAGSKGIEVKATIVPISASETTILKDNKCNCIGPCGESSEKDKPTPREEANVEFELHTIELIGVTDAEDEESEPDEDTAAGSEDLIVKAAKKLGIKTE